jgi:hypothetical protein
VISDIDSEFVGGLWFDGPTNIQKDNSVGGWFAK